jgi:flagellar hook assembly protein FlgD
MRDRIRILRLSAVLAAALIVSQCGSSSPSNPTPTPTPTPTGPALTGIISSVQAADGTQATQQTGTPPTAQAGGPTIQTSAGSAAIPGGSEVVTISSATAFQSLYVSVPTAPGLSASSFDPNRIGAEVAANGYWLLRFPSAVTSAVIITNLSTTLSANSSFQIGYAAANAAGTIGPTVTSSRTTVGSTGNVQVNVSWNTATDVDLHVVDPTNQEIYYGSPQSTNGGSLDVDSNAGCSLDNKQSENIRWGSSAPNGTYTVRVDYWSACNVSGTTTFTVTINNGGQRSQFTGTFAAGNADSGSRGSGRTITTFSHTTGISPSAAFQPIFVDLPFTPSALKLRLSRPPQ